MKVSQSVVEIVSTLAVATMGVTTTFQPQPQLAALSTGTLFAAQIVGARGRKRDKTERAELQARELQERLDASTRTELELRETIRLFEGREVKTQQMLSDFAAANIERQNLREKLESVTAQIERYQDDRVKLLDDLSLAHQDKAAIEAHAKTLTEQHAAALERQRKEWATKFDDLIREQEAEQKALTQKLYELERELNRFRDSKDIIVENATLLVTQKAKELEEQLGKVNASNATLTNHVGESAAIITELQGEFQYLTSDGFAQLQEMHAQQLALCQRELTETQAMLTQCRAPQMFDQIGDYARADKLIEQIYARTGAVLDASEITPTDEGSFEVALNVRDRKSRGEAFVKSLSDMGDVLMVDVACIEPLRFRFDAQNPHRILTKLRYRKAIASAKSLPWKSAEQFIGIAGKWSRVRITGGSESGKSPLAELVVGAMQQVKGAMSVSVAFPLVDSVKNNWTLKLTHTGSYKAVFECARETVALMKSHPPQFHVSVLDECDTSLKEYRDLAGEVKELIKTGSHANVGVILLGQNANVKQWTGFDRSDFENIVNVHIGGNAYHALENSNLSQAQKDKLKAQADTLTKHCEAVNAGIDEADKLTRFALVIDPTKTPYFIQLPVFGSITYDYRLEAKTPPTLESDSGVQCKHCGGDSYKRNGSYANGDARYKCLSKGCGKAFR
jgi:hypothetical protein